MTVDAPLIVRGFVTGVKTIGGRLQDVRIAVEETLKGDKARAVTMRWSFANSTSAEAWKKDGHERLFFLEAGEQGMWALYDAYPYAPVDLVSVDNAPVSSDMTVAKSAGQILDKIKKRLGRQAGNGSVRLDVPEGSQAYSVLWGGSACFLIVPSDEGPFH
ncbi:MAG: hypothetical protein HY591_00775 [Candidatus Omnitrophica bacterium]|nr:hypothetical protein [Candidatus Omnitrophota bacterium]